MSANRVVLFGTVRVVLPFALLAATILRYNVLSLVYGLFLLICPLLTTPTTAPITAYSRAYFILLVVVSSVFTVGHAAFQGYLLAANHGNDTEIATFCSNEEIILRSVGFQRLVGVDWSEILRLLAPDIIMTIISALSLALSLRLQFKPAPSTQAAPTMSRVSRLSYTRKTHRKILRFMELGILLFFLAISSVIHPCMLSSVYFLSFLFLATWVACWRTLGVKFAVYRLVLLVYSGLHLTVLYLYQFQVAQNLISKDGFYARLLGLTAIIKTDCSSPSSFIIWPNKLPVYSNPGFILALYWVLACETRYWWSRRVLLTEADDQTNYETMGPAATPDGAPLTPETDAQEEMTELPPPSEPDEDISTALLQLRSPLVTIGRFVLDQSYLFTLIAMMAWSITYHCWLTFVYLLSACVIWMVPKPQRICLPASPVILAYALGLLIVQYIYGFNLNDDELPVVTESGLKLTQIGLKKYDNPWKPLAIQLGFTVVFWMNLCQFTLQKGLNNPKPDPATVRMEKVSNGGKKSAALKRLASAIFWKVVARYWILVCVTMFLVLTLQNRVVIYKIVYMVLFLYFAIGFQLFYRCWRLTLFAFWWVVIIYSMIVLCVIYTYQFEDFPEYWHNGTGLSYVFLSDLGLEEYDTAELFEQLLVPTAFLTIIILQVNYFHPAFMSVSALDRYKDMTLPEFETPESETPPGHLPRPSSGHRHSLTEDAEHFLRFMVLNTDRYGRFLAWIVWRVLEVHVFKLVAVATMLVAIFDVSAIGMIFILILVTLMPFRRARRVLSSLVMMWAALAILAKMTYQLRTLDVSYWFSNCTYITKYHLFADEFYNYGDLDPVNGTGVQGRWKTYNAEKFPFNGTIDTAHWVGLQKSERVGIYIVGLIMLVLALLFESVVRVHQEQLSQSPVFPKPRFDIIFPATMRRHADDDFLSCMKFLANYFFYKFGLEVCTIMIAVTAAVRSDSFAVLYALILGLLLLSPRRLCARAWPAFMCLMVFVIILQYATAVGLPPAACIDYPWAGALNNILEQWLHLPDYSTPPDTKRMIADFCVLLFVCLQYKVFQVEVGPNLELYGGGDNTVLNGDIDFKSSNPTQDFIKPKKSMLDYVRSILFMHMFWVTLAAIFITSIQRINLFCLGYMIGCFAILWSGQNLLLQPRTKLLRVWGLLLAYNYLVILCRTFLQLIACVYYQSLHTKYCIVTELFSLVCQANLRITDPGEPGKYECEDPSSSTLFWDVVCLIFIIIQRRAYCTNYFRHVVTEIHVQTLLASDGARLINRRMIQEVIDYKEKEKAHLDRIRRKMDWLKEQQKRNGEDKMFASEMHYTVIRSGDYTLFDDPDDEKYWEELIEEKDKKAGALEVIGAAIEGGTKAGMERAKTPDESDGPSRQTSLEPKETDETIADEEEVPQPGIYTKSKNILILCWTVVFRCLESMLDCLLSISEEYRTMAGILDREKIRMKREIRERAGEVIEDPEPQTQPVAPTVDESAVTIEIEDLPAIDEPSSTAVSHLSPSGSAIEIKSEATTAPPLPDEQTQDASQSSFLTRLISAVYYVIVSHSEVVCFFLLILDHMMSASALSLWLPISIFLWALLAVPRPTRTYWIVMITYLEAILILKFFFQFQFLPWNQAEVRAVKATDPFWFPRIVGFALRPDFASYDLACLLAIFLHRSILKRYGLWSDFNESDEDEEEEEKELAEGGEEVARAPPPPVPEAKKARPEPELSEDAVTPSEPYEQLPPEKETKGAARDVVCGPFRSFYRAMTANKYLKHTDVYTSMFFCDIITFLIVVFGYSYFGPASAGDEGNVTSYLTENRIPGPFLAMLLIQFCFIVIDRALYLKKCVVGKLVFQIILVIGVHVWIFFLLPYITQRKFVDNLAAKLWYFVKCIYFGFSAYQITCGYPTQILGNILTRGYSIANKFAFKIFLGIPFLLELRSLMDWIWTQTSLDLLCWLTVEEIYANVFLVKCERKIEEAYPTPRGVPRGSLMKYLVGGSQLLLIIFLIWFPLLLFSFAFVISAPFPPLDCTVEISIGGYQPLFKMSAQVQSIMKVPEEDFAQLRSSYSREGKNQKVIGFMNNYESVDVRRIEVSGKSTSVWGISPPSQKQLNTILLNDTSAINMYFHISFLRDAAGKESAGVAQQTLTYPLQYQSKVRTNLANMVLDLKPTPVLIPELFPRFFRVYADGKVKPVKPMTDGSVIGYSNVTVLLKSGDLPGFTGTQEWMQVHEEIKGTVLEPDATKEKKSLNILTIFAFNDRAAPAVLSFIPGTGTIIGIYISFILVLGKVIRTMFTGLMSDIKYRQMPYVERIQELIYNLYLARESMDLRLEEELFAKLLFVYRSPETMIKYSQYPKNKED